MVTSKIRRYFGGYYKVEKYKSAFLLLMKLKKIYSVVKRK